MSMSRSSCENTIVMLKSLNMSLKVSHVSVEAGGPPLALNSFYTSFKYHLRMIGHGVLVNLTHYLIYKIGNSVHPCIVKLIALLELGSGKIFCQRKLISILQEYRGLNNKFCP